MAAIPEKRPPKAGRRSEKSTKEKTLESGSGFLPNVGRKRLLRSIREEKDPTARDRMVACLHRKDGCSIRDICKIMVRPYSPMRDWLWRMQDGVQEETPAQAFARKMPPRGEIVVDE